MSNESEDIQQMAEMLKHGATLTELACPACASPLFRHKGGELWCAKCQKRVIVLKEGESAEGVTSQARLVALENTVLKKIRTVEKRIQEEDNVDELQKLNAVLKSLLDNLKTLREMKQS